MKAGIKKSFVKGLSNFKGYVENLPQWPARTSGIRLEKTPEMQAVVVVGQSAMDNISQSMGEVYDRVMKYAMDKHLDRKGNLWESYLTDPLTERDSSKWITRVYYPIE